MEELFVFSVKFLFESLSISPSTQTAPSGSFTPPQHVAGLYVQPLSLTELDVTISLPTHSPVKNKRNLKIYFLHGLFPINSHVPYVSNELD